MAADLFTVEYLVLDDGSCPFEEWLADLPDDQAEAHIARRLLRVRLGNFGDCKSVTKEVRELRIDHGPGYRVYFAMRGRTMVVIICAGTKRFQGRDIRKAAKLWELYKNAH
jgi:putative addiction module killer protein